MSRHGNRWTVNEILALQREYELLELSICEIALRHQRSENAIIMKLEAEGFLEVEEEEEQCQDSDLEEDPFFEVDSVDNDFPIDSIYKLNLEEITNLVGKILKRLTFLDKKANYLNM